MSGLNKLFLRLRKAINLVSFIGVLSIANGIGSFITGKYAAGNFGEISPGQYAGVLSALQVSVGAIILYIGVKHNNKTQEK